MKAPSIMKKLIVKKRSITQFGLAFCLLASFSASAINEPVAVSSPANIKAQFIESKTTKEDDWKSLDNGVLEATTHNNFYSGFYHLAPTNFKIELTQHPEKFYNYLKLNAASFCMLVTNEYMKSDSIIEGESEGELPTGDAKLILEKLVELENGKLTSTQKFPLSQGTFEVILEGNTVGCSYSQGL